MNSILTLSISLIMIGCVIYVPVYQSEVLAICEDEYRIMGADNSNKSSMVLFKVEPAGRLLSKDKYENEKAAILARSNSTNILEKILSAGNECPEIGARALYIIWTDDESITVTTSDEMFDIQATMLYEQGRVPINLKQLAKNISYHYDQMKRKKLQPGH